MSPEIKKKLLIVSFAVTLLYSLHFAIPLYVNSIMLESMIGKEFTSLVIMLGAISALFVTTHLGQTVKKYHNYTTTISFLLISIVTTTAIAFSNSGLITSLLYIIHFVCVAVMFIMINLYIEEFTDVDEEGSTRGIFLTLLNTGILVAPLVAGLLVSTSGYSGVYLVSALCLVPVIFLLNKFYIHIKEPKYKNVNYLEALREARKDKNIKGALISLLCLESFYVLMSVYAGIYITETVGIPLGVYLGVIMPFALIPFVLLPYGLGKLADIKTGEKEMMVIGTIIIASSVLAASLLDTKNILIWGIVLFTARFGAAMLESMIFTYFFKKVNRTDAGLVALFGSIRTIGFIVVPLIGSITLLFVDDIRYLFYIFIIFAIYSLLPVLRIRDTK